MQFMPLGTAHFLASSTGPNKWPQCCMKVPLEMLPLSSNIQLSLPLHLNGCAPKLVLQCCSHYKVESGTDNLAHAHTHSLALRTSYLVSNSSKSSLTDSMTALFKCGTGFDRSSASEVANNMLCLGVKKFKEKRLKEKKGAPCEDRTHDLQIMRLTRCLLR